MKDIELIENKTSIDTSIDFKYSDTEIKFDNCIESYGFWDDIERQANRAKFRLEKLNPKQSFEFDFRMMMTTPEQRKAGFITHLKGKYPEMDVDNLFDIIEKEVNSITLTGPDDNHPNPYFKFKVNSDLIKSVIFACVNKYEEYIKIHNQMASRFTKKKPEFVYFWGSGEWIQGPYMNPQKGRDNIKYKLMDENKFNAQQELIKVLENQVADLSIMSKIELGDDVIDEIRRLKEILIK